MAEHRRLLMRAWPDSLLGRITVVMALGVVCAHFAASALWQQQQQGVEQAEMRWAAQQLASNAASTIRHLSDTPEHQRDAAIEALQRAGATRYFIYINPALQPLQPLQDKDWAESVSTLIRIALARQLQPEQAPQVALLHQNALTPEQQTSPLLVIQHALDDQHWLYLSTAFADTALINSSSPFSTRRTVWQLLTLVLVLLPTLLVVRSLIRPLDRIADAARAFDSAASPEPITETGTAELRRTARAFNEMLARIQGYLLDRERLFIGISHSLKTPIMRLKLRTEMLADSALRREFHEDLDDLNRMVQTALQSLRDTDIHENQSAVRLDLLLARLVRRPILPDAGILFEPVYVQVLGKPLALERALGNLLDNAVLYGNKVEVRLSHPGALAMIQIRDFGPGIAPASITQAFEPHMRLGHGKSNYRSGSGLGLGIARNIIHAHGGEIRLHNHVEGGLVVTVLLPANPFGCG